MRFWRREKTYKIRVNEEELRMLVFATKTPYDTDHWWESDDLHCRLYELAKPRRGDPEYEHLKKLATESINQTWPWVAR